MTREPMFIGMPYKYFLFAMVAFVISFAKIDSYIFNGLFAGTLWIVGLELGRRDPRLVDILAAKFKLPRIPGKLKAYWHHRTYSPK